MANHETPMRVHYTVNDSDILSLGCFVYLCGIINNKICTANEKQKYIYREGEGSPFWGIYSQPFVPNLRVDFLDAVYRAMEIFIFLMGKRPRHNRYKVSEGNKLDQLGDNRICNLALKVHAVNSLLLWMSSLIATARISG